MTLTSRELATILAALRHWQRGMASHRGISGPNAPTQWAFDQSFEHFDEQPPLTIPEIDDLCARLNTET